MDFGLLIAIISMFISLFILIYSIRMYKVQTEIEKEAKL